MLSRKANIVNSATISLFAIIFGACRNPDYDVIQNKETKFEHVIQLYDSLSKIHFFYLEFTKNNVLNVFMDDRIFDSKVENQSQISQEFERNGIAYSAIGEMISEMKSLPIYSIAKYESEGCTYTVLGTRNVGIDRQMQYIVHQNFYSQNKCKTHSFPTGAKKITEEIYLFNGRSLF